MRTIIAKIDGWAELTADEIHSLLSETVAVPTNTAVTVSDVSAAVGDEAAALVVGTLESGKASNPLLGPALIAMSTTGMQLSSNDRQAMIDMLAAAGGWSDGVRDAIKSLGVRRPTRWAHLGGDGEVPTVEAVQVELSAMLAAAYGETLVQRIGAAIRLAAAADGATEQTIREAAIAEIG